MKLLDAIKGAGLKTRLLHPVDEFWDRRFGVHTVGFLPEVGDPNHPDFRAAYVPAQYRRIIAALRRADIGPDDIVVDLGCGLGRAVFAASWLGAKRAVGVEIDPPLVAKARESLRGSRLESRNIEFICAPAETYAQTDTTLIFMFNPFGAGIMQAVVRQLEEALDKRPRKLRIVYENPLQGHVLDASHHIKRTGEWPAGKAGSHHPLAFWETA